MNMFSIYLVYTYVFRNLASSSPVLRITSISKDENNIADIFTKYACGMSQIHLLLDIIIFCYIWPVF